MDIPGIFESAKQVVDLLGGGVDLTQKLRNLVKSAQNGKLTAQDVTELTLELHDKIIRAQTAQATLMNDLLKLKGQMMDMQRRLELEARYQLNETPAGAQLLALRPQYHADEPLHYICPACADRGQKSILQPQGTGKRCHPCDTFFPFTPQDNTPRRVRRPDSIF